MNSKTELVSGVRNSAATEVSSRNGKPERSTPQSGTGRLLVEKLWTPATGASLETHAPDGRNA